ncbi:E3 ubiquitin-protein ligase SNT2 [Paramyrothecium foliicola]|nr:E3 ubiquitin-protein ligase SNT2 [Paramyrothecium foliicola]
MAQQNDSSHPEPNGQSAREQMSTTTGPEDGDKDAGLDSGTPYGTRSRNRTGNPRPNYAEDKDIDTDVYDYYHDKKDSEPKKTSRQSGATSGGDAARGSTSTRKPVPDDAKSGPPSQNGSKEQNAGGGATNASQATQAASGAVQPSRKRKAAAQQAGGGTASTKKTGNAAQNTGTAWPESNMLTFDNCKARPENGRMVADDGTVLEPNDHVYLVCEPPGEPYYLGRIMEFLHFQNDSARPVDAVRINWYYRPKDIGRKAPDTRMVFATMHSDISPLTSLRGKCQIRHRVEIASMDEYRKTPDSFWFEKLYDRYIQKNYDLIPTRSIVNVPEKVKKVLDERWKYVLVEQGRGKELISAVKLCKRCSGYCASRAQERKLEARHTPNVVDPHGDEVEEDELLEEDEDDHNTGRTSPAEDDHNHHQGTAEQVYQASLWPYRYLGIHCKPEDALDYDDRIYPRASTRVGPKHQAAVSPWPGQPVQYVKPLEIKRGGKNQGKLSKEALAAHEAEKARRGQRPPWVQDQPPGYVARGEDYDESDPNCTATLLWKPPAPETISEEQINDYMSSAKNMWKKLNLPERSTNLQDIAMETLCRNKFKPSKALETLAETDHIIFKEPSLLPAEQKKFEEAISKYGSELHLVMKHVKTLSPGEVVRYYYTWKKTDRGKQVWGSAPGRKGKREAKKAEAAASKFADDLADNDDDSAFDSMKATEKKRSFVCQFCSTTHSRQWRRAPNSAQSIISENGAKANSKDKGNQCVTALCRRCAELWRRYGIRWEDIEEVSKKLTQSGRAWRRKQDEELLKELQAAQEMGMLTPDRGSTPASTVTPTLQEPPRKKLKGAPEKDLDNVSSDAGSAAGIAASKKKEKSLEGTPSVTEMPKPRTLPCAICNQLEPLGDQHLSCRECRLTVHRNCYGVMDSRNQAKWTCEMCANDKSPQVSIHYKCVLCPVEHTEHDFIEQPKLTHHKKKMSEKDREREKLEVQQARKAADYFRKKQEDMNRPVNPREPLKRTADNNWVHVTCAVWTPEVKFGNAKVMEPSEGIPSIPRSRYDETCQVCQKQEGACVYCHQCRVPYHVECARQHGHVLGFDVTPVKSSRRDQFNIVTLNGESGTMSAAIWCKDHVPTKTVTHQMHDVVNESGLNALQLFVQNYKQADLTLTGTVRKANLMMMAAKMSGAPIHNGHIKSPAAAAPSTGSATTTAAVNGTAGLAQSTDDADGASNAQRPGEKVCITCGVDVSPKWWPVDNTQTRELTNGHHGTIGSEAQKFVEQRKFQCHKCRKTHRAPQPHVHRPWSASATQEGPRLTAPDQNMTIPASAHQSPSLPPLNDYREGSRDGRPPGHAWPQHPPQLAAAAPSQVPPLPGTSHPMGPRPVPVTQPYGPAALSARPPYSDWGHRPGSQHGSPPRLLNGPPPNGPPVTSLTSLRPPAMAGPPPVGPGLVPHQQSPPTQPYANGIPSSPRRLNGPVPPAPYVPPHYGVQGQGAPPHGLPNGVPPPRPEAYPHGIHAQRPAYAGPHGSPPGSRNGPPPARDAPMPTGPVAPRASENTRPTSGASASPSLRNLLS